MKFVLPPTHSRVASFALLSKTLETLVVHALATWWNVIVFFSLLHFFLNSARSCTPRICKKMLNTSVPYRMQSTAIWTSIPRAMHTHGEYSSATSSSITRFLQRQWLNQTSTICMYVCCMHLWRGKPYKKVKFMYSMWIKGCDYFTWSFCYAHLWLFFQDGGKWHFRNDKLHNSFLECCGEIGRKNASVISSVGGGGAGGDGGGMARRLSPIIGNHRLQLFSLEEGDSS